MTQTPVYSPIYPPTPLKDCAAFIFDMDGTLTVPQHDFDAIRRALDIPQGALILEYLDELPRETQQRKRLELEKIEADIASESQPAPGLIELLDALQQQSLGVAVLTRNSAANAHISLRAIGAIDYFTPETIIGREEAAPKPDPAGINLLAERLGVRPTECAMVGDYRHDLEAAAAAGAHSVHLAHPDSDSWPLVTHTTVQNLHTLRSLL